MNYIKVGTISKPLIKRGTESKPDSDFVTERFAQGMCSGKFPDGMKITISSFASIRESP